MERIRSPLHRSLMNPASINVWSDASEGEEDILFYLAMQLVYHDPTIA